MRTLPHSKAYFLPLPSHEQVGEPARFAVAVLDSAVVVSELTCGAAKGNVARQKDVTVKV